MSTVTTPTKTRKPRTKPLRTIRLVVSLNEQGQNGLVRITEATTLASGEKRVKIEDYHLSKIPSDFGEAFLIEKVDFWPLAEGAEESRYHVLFQNEQDHSCECRGFTRWGRCRHVSGILALRKAGKL